MTRKSLIVVAGIGLVAAGCNFSGGFGKLETAVSTTLTRANNALSRLSENNLPTACSIVAVAEGYFHQLEPRISAANIAAERKAEAIVADICSNPPSDVGKAFGALFRAWMTIQDATKAS